MSDAWYMLTYCCFTADFKSSKYTLHSISLVRVKTRVFGISEGSTDAKVDDRPAKSFYRKKIANKYIHYPITTLLVHLHTNPSLD